jgi:hypothetical protein
MTYVVTFGPDTNTEKYDTMDEIYEWLDEYIIQHLQYNEIFETEKQKFIDNCVSEE